MTLYRYENCPCIDRERLDCYSFEVERETPAGYWIRTPGGSKLPVEKWISKTGSKRYAYPTKEQAYRSFIARKKRQIKILERQRARAIEALNLPFA